MSRLAHLLARTQRTAIGCLEWQGCVQSNGYGRATVEKKTDFVHRHVFRLSRGDIPAGFDVCHRCDVRRCIEPSHLFLGTRTDNMRDAVVKGRTARGARLPQTKLSDDARATVIRRARRGDPYKVIARDFSVSPQLVGKVAIAAGIRRVAR